MIASRFLGRTWLALVLSLFAAGAIAQAQPAKQDYEPYIGQEGKDVVWVPSSSAIVERMLDLAQVTAKDYVMDLGSGDGRTVIAAARRGARALGVEYNPDLVELSKRAAAKEGVSERAQFVKADLFQMNFSDATVITLFLLPDLNIKLRPRILDLRPGTRIVSNSFNMGEWKPDQTARVTEKEGCETYCTAHFRIVPAKVDGIWKLPQGELKLKQEFQMISGTLRTGERLTPITNGRLRGDAISFESGGAKYTGRVVGDAIEGVVSSGGASRTWSAARGLKPAPARS